MLCCTALGNYSVNALKQCFSNVEFLYCIVFPHDRLLKKLQPRAWIQGWSYGLGNF